MYARTVAIIGLLLLFGVALCRAADEPKLELKEYASKQGKYKLLLPGTAKAETAKIGGTTFTTIVAPVGEDRAFAVAHSGLPVAGPIAAEAAKEILKDIHKPLKDKAAKVTYDKDLAVGPDKLPAQECLVETTAGKFYRQRVVIAGDRMYTISAVGPEGFVTSKDADRVFESFAVTK